MNVQFGFSFGYAAWTGAPGASTAFQPAGAPAPAQVPAAANGQGATASGGHVVSNSTNALASGSAGAAQGGHSLSQLGGAHAMPAGAFAQGVMLTPVFVTLGFPVVVVYAPGSGNAQPPAANPPATDSGAPPPAAGQPAGEPPAAESPAGPEAPEAEQPVNGGSGRPRVSIADLDPEDFEKFRLKHLAASLETTLELELETRDGDRVTLDFSQLDTSERSRFRGVDADGERVRLHERSRDMQRLVNMEVNGELSEQEKAAIDGVLGQVIELAREFFGGSFERAVARLNDLDFDTSTLLDMSLEMSMSRRVEMARSYASGGEALGHLAERDGEVAKTLEFFADGQRRLIDAARELLNDPSAVKMVRSVLPPLLQSPQELVETPLGELVQKLARHGSDDEQGVV